MVFERNFSAAPPAYLTGRPILVDRINNLLMDLTDEVPAYYLEHFIREELNHCRFSFRGLCSAEFQGEMIAAATVCYRNQIITLGRKR